MADLPRPQLLVVRTLSGIFTSRPCIAAAGGAIELLRPVLLTFANPPSSAVCGSVERPVHCCGGCKGGGSRASPYCVFPRRDQAGFVPPLTGPTLVPMHGDFVLGLRGKLRRLRAVQSSIRSDPLRQMPLMVYACPRSKAPSQKRCGGSAGTTGGCGFPRPDSARNGDMLCHVARGVAAIAARDAFSLLSVASSPSSSSPLPLLVARTKTCPVLTSSTEAARRFQRHAPVSVDRGAAGGPRFPGAPAWPAPTIFARWAVHGDTGAGALHPLHCRSRSVGGAGGSEAPAGGGSLRPLGRATEERSIFFYLHAPVFPAVDVRETAPCGNGS